MTERLSDNQDQGDSWEDSYTGPDGTGYFLRCPTPRLSSEQIAQDKKAEEQRKNELGWKLSKKSAAARERFLSADRDARVAQQSDEVRARIAAWQASLEKPTL